MGCSVADLLGWLDERFPPQTAESWDTVGLQVGDPRARVERVLVALDPTEESLEEARRKGASALIVHHPAWIGPIKSIVKEEPVGKIIWMAIQGGVSILCVHTNLDRSLGGPNDLLARKLGLSALETLGCGLGRIGDLERPLTLEELCKIVFGELGPSRIVGDPRKMIRKVAVICGSGSSLMEEAKRAGADALITGDVKYHDARQAQAMGLAVIDPGHFATERILVSWLAHSLREVSEERNWGLEVLEFQGEKDPFWVP
jgi:dinuclear metal center YbgI/SA1388 family protein